MDQFNGPVNKKSHAFLGMVIMVSVFLLAWYFSIKVQKAYPYENARYKFVVQSPVSGDFQVLDELGFWKRAQAFCGLTKITPYEMETTYKFEGVDVMTSDGLRIALDLNVNANFENTSRETIGFYLYDDGNNRVESLIGSQTRHAAMTSGLLVTIDQIMDSREGTKAFLYKLINDQLKNGVMTVDVNNVLLDDSTSRRVLSIRHDKHGKPVRHSNEVLDDIELRLENIDGIEFDDTALKIIEARAEAQLKAQKLIAEAMRLEVELKAQASKQNKADIEKIIEMEKMKLQKQMNK